MRKKLSKNRFAQLCYLILMQNGEGILDKHPDYIIEKRNVLKRGYSAYGSLDRINQNVLLMYFKKWELELPKEIVVYEEESRKVAINMLLSR